MKLKRQIKRIIQNRQAPKPACYYLPSQSYYDKGIIEIDQSRKNITSQHGEDGILEYLAAKLQLKEKTCLEVGAWDGKHLSNTWNLIENAGWTGVLIEANPQKFAQLNKAHSNPSKNVYLNEFIGFENNTLDDLLERHFKKPMDVMVIDIDGNDWYVFETLKTYLPNVVVIEYNASIPNDLYFVQEKDSDFPAGSSLSSIIALGKEKGYEAVFATQTNVILVQNSLFPLLDIKDNSIQSLKPGLQYEAIIFEGFDGTIYSYGKKKKTWEEEEIAKGTWVYLDEQPSKKH